MGDDDDDDDRRKDDASAEETIRRLVKEYANAIPDKNDGPAAQPSSQTVQAAEAEETSICIFCQQEVEEEAILPCYHTG